MGSNYFFWGLVTFVLALAAIPGVSVMFVLNLLLPKSNVYILAGAGLFTMIFLIWIWAQNAAPTQHSGQARHSRGAVCYIAGKLEMAEHCAYTS